MRLAGERSEDTTVVWTFSSCENARIDGARSVAWETEGLLFIFFLSWIRQTSGSKRFPSDDSLLCS